MLEPDVSAEIRTGPRLQQNPRDQQKVLTSGSPQGVLPLQNHIHIVGLYTQLH